jgi:hypothetical protein
MPAWVGPCADDVPLGAVSVEADWVGPWPGDDAGSPCRDLVVWGADSGTLGHTTPGDTAPAPRSSGAMNLGVNGLLLLEYSSSSFPGQPIVGVFFTGKKKRWSRSHHSSSEVIS